MIEITQQDYLRIAEALKQELSEREFFNGHIKAEIGGYEAMLTATLIIYHSLVEYPEGERLEISDVVPVWWKFEVFDDDRFELFNDFSFNELRPLLRT